MRVGLVCGSYPPIKCGVGDFTYRLAATLAEFEHGVVVITSAARETGRPGPGRVALREASWGTAAAPGILRTLRHAGTEVLNVQYPTHEYGRHPLVNLLPLLARRRLGLPTVATIHEYGSFTWAGRVRLAVTALASQRVIVTDVGNQELLRRRLGKARDKIVHIPIGSNLSCSPPPDYDRAAQRARLGAGSGTLVLAYFGFISPSKGLHELLGAFTMARQSAPGLDLQLWLVADREPAAARYRGYHEAFARELRGFPYRDRVAWTGYLEPAEVSAHLLAADVGVLPFVDGASPRRGSLLALLNHGLPVISTRVADNASGELVENSGTLLVPARDQGALAEAVLSLGRDPGPRRELSSQARRFASTFSWASIAERTVAVYEEARRAVGRRPPA